MTVLYSQISFPSSAFFTFLHNKQKQGIQQQRSGSENIVNPDTIPTRSSNDGIYEQHPKMTMTIAKMMIMMT